MESKITDEKKEELIKDNEQDEFRPDWIFLAEMDLNISFNCSFDLRSRDINRNNDWINDPK